MKMPSPGSPLGVAMSVVVATIVLVVALAYAMFFVRPLGVDTSTIAAANAYSATLELKRAVRLRLDDVRWSDVDFAVAVDRFSLALSELNGEALSKIPDQQLIKSIEAVKKVAVSGPSQVPDALETLDHLEGAVFDVWRSLDTEIAAAELKARGHTATIYSLVLLLVTALGVAIAFFAHRLKRYQLQYEAAAKSANALQMSYSRLQDRFSHALKAKNEFLAMVSHELRSPLQTLVSSIQLLDNPESDAAKILPRLKRSSLALETQLGDLLSLAKADRVNFETGPVALSALIARASSPHRAQAKAAGLRFVAEAPKSTWVVETCGVRLFQVLDNLLSNAVRYTPKGSIHVSVSGVDSASTSLTIKVKDTGYGIKAEDLPRIFLPFTQFHTLFEPAQTSGRGRRGGMGLAIVKALIDGIGGSVSVESTVGQGTTFTVTVPCRPLFPTRLSVREETAVLVVDDEPDILDAITDVLRLEHVDVQMAKSVSEAVRAWDSAQPLLMLVDLNLPDGNGRDIAKKVRSACLADGNKVRPVLVAMSAAFSEGAVPDGVFDGFLPKPIDASQLSHLVNALSFDAEPH